MKRSLIKLGSFVIFLTVVFACQTKNLVSHTLKGEWKFALDSNDIGEIDVRIGN